MLVVLQALLAVALLVTWWAAPTLVILPRVPWTNAMSLAFAGVGLGLGLQALAQLGSSFGVHPRPRDEALLVTTGIYAVLRHPMYTGVLAMLVAATVAAGDLYVALLALVNAIFYLVKARYEEGLLAARYPAYAKYRARTFGVLPFKRG